MRRTTRSRFARLLMSAGLLACKGSSDTSPSPSPSVASRTVIIGYSAPKLVGGQYRIHESLERNARQKGWQVITTISGGAPGKQAEQIRNFLSLGVSAVVAVPDDSRGICEAVTAAKAANVPFYTIDRAPEGCRINMAVLADNAMAGRQSAEALLERLRQKYGEPKGVILEVVGDPAHNVAQLRGNGFHEVIRKNPGVKVVSKVADWDAAKVEAVLREVLTTTPELDGIYLHSDAAYTPATLKVLGELGRLHRRDEPGHIFLAGVDGSPVGVKSIKDGYADQCSNQPVPDFGIVADWIEQEFKGKSIIEGEVTREDALWSPARVTMTEIGPQLFLSTTSVTEKNMDDARLWANQP